MEKTYQPEEIETQWYQTWEQAGYFQPSMNGPSYCIMLPPPNVTGTLHMGHGFQVSLMDALIRYHRMRGFNTLWQVGTDHAGIATQMVVELQLQNEGSSRHELGRNDFVKRVWKWKDQSDGTIKNQLRRLGASVDWNKERFSMDEQLTAAVQEVFLKLYDEGLIYRGKRLVNWDPKLLTAISDLEVLNKEEDGTLWYIRYPIIDDQGSEVEAIVVATTRPETLLGDTAVAVHPGDERYTHLIGKHILLPLTERVIPIIADESIDCTFGTGCVKITPAHDFNDYALGQKHHLPLINIFTADAHLNDQVPEKYRGLERFEARKKILADLTTQHYLVKTEPHKLKVPRGERSGVVIEPYLTDQWFVKMEPFAEEAIAAVKEGKIEFVPYTWTKTYFQWLENIQDWCISRQLWWGHRIPAWYDDAGNVYVGRDEDHIRERYNLATQLHLHQDDDVLDTWFSSALWPFATLGWPHQTDDFRIFYPTDVLVTGFDIIFFWVARMIMMGLKFTNTIPFKHVYITGLVRDAEGQKMSKSKGNILDPIDLIDGIALDDLVHKRTQNLLHRSDAEHITKLTHHEFPKGIPAYGTDSLRFTYYSLASTGRDVRFDLHRVEGYRNFCNKIWNAARYVLMNVENKDLDLVAGSKELSLPDRWIRSLLQKTIQKTHDMFAEYRFDLLAQNVYEFVWNEYCDWYLELAKIILNSPDSKDIQLRGTRYTLIAVLEITLRLIHPLMPFITEEIWQRIARLLGNEGATIMLQSYPQSEDNLVDSAAEHDIEWLKAVIVAIRNIRGEMNIPPGKKIPLFIKEGSENDRDRLNRYGSYITNLAKVSQIEPLEKTPPLSATVIVNELELLIPMLDIIDKQSEISRLNKEISKLEKDLERSKTKLNNPDYIAKAPEDVVKKEQARLLEVQQTLDTLQQRVTLLHDETVES